MNFILTICIFVSLFITSTISLKDEFLLVQKYLRHKNLKRCRFIHCWPKKVIVSAMRDLKMFSNFWNIGLENRTPNLNSEYDTLNVLFYKCNKSIDVLEEIAEDNGFSYKQKLLIIQYSAEFQTRDLEKMKFRFDSDVKLVRFTGENVQIYEIYHTGYKKNGTFRFEYYGCWNKTSNELIVKDLLRRYHQKSILSGVVLSSSTVITNPKVQDNYDDYLLERKPVDLVSKFSYSLFINFKQMHNFRHVRYLKDKWFGNDVGGFAEGVAKDLHEEISDLSSAVGLIKSSRVEFFDFINPMYRFSTSFMFRNRGTHDLWQNEFLKPFTTSVWLSIALLLILLSALLKMTNRIETMLMSSERPYSFYTAILITISVVCQQGSSITPSRLTSRFLFFIILTLSFLLYNYYTSSIVSALLNTKPKELRTFKDLIRSGLELGIQMAPYTMTIFETNMDPDIQAIRRLVFPPRGKPHIWNITDGLEKVRTGGFAYHVESSRAYILIAKTFDAGAICELSDRITLIPDSYLSLYGKKDFQYKLLLKISLRKMEESGIVHRNRLIWEEKKPSCFGNAILLSVGLDQTFIAFFILFIGFSTAITLLFVEILFNRRRKLVQVTKK